VFVFAICLASLIAREMSLGAASSFENEPRVLMVFRIVMGKLSIGHLEKL